MQLKWSWSGNKSKLFSFHHTASEISLNIYDSEITAELPHADEILSATGDTGDLFLLLLPLLTPDPCCLTGLSDVDQAQQVHQLEKHDHQADDAHRLETLCFPPHTHLPLRFSFCFYGSMLSFSLFNPSSSLRPHPSDGVTHFSLSFQHIFFPILFLYLALPPSLFNWDVPHQLFSAPSIYFLKESKDEQLAHNYAVRLIFLRFWIFPTQTAFKASERLILFLLLIFFSAN